MKYCYMEAFGYRETLMEYSFLSYLCFIIYSIARTFLFRELTRHHDKAHPILCCIPKYGTPSAVLSVTVVSGSGLKKMSRFGVGMLDN